MNRVLFVVGLLLSGVALGASSSEKRLREGYAAYDAEDYDLAASRLLPFERKGPPRARFLLAMMYLNGLSVPHDLDKGKGLLTEAAAGGDMDAAYVLGSEQLREGTFFPVNVPEALRYLAVAADKGHGEALHELGWIYYEPGSLGVKADHDRAFKYFQKSALLYEQSPYALGFLYSKGHGTERNNLEACSWALVSEKLGDRRAQAVLTAVKPLLSMSELAKANKLAGQRLEQLSRNIEKQRSVAGHGR